MKQRLPEQGLSTQETAGEQEAAKAQEAAGEDEALTLEEAFERLEDMASQLEDREVSLEDTIRIYQKGMELLKMCRDKIDLAEKKVLMVDEEGNLDEF